MFSTTNKKPDKTVNVNNCMVRNKIFCKLFLKQSVL